ncbi:MAG: hypothetical protein BWK77_00780 [Verrucomicrobia bacterium A1]|nr:MAG: hypothetical protein BWK77_00780 [Verrucomicrobia bacterium A1]
MVQVAGLGWDLAQKKGAIPDLPPFRRCATIFPALTCTVQASFRTASLPSAHGVVGNGWFFRELGRPMFWEQSAALVQGPRVWAGRGGRVGMMFWQQSLGESADLVLSPRPIHKHHGGMIQDCYSRPADLYERVTAHVGRPFNLMHYWGPLASAKSSEWIAAATQAVMEDSALAPELLFTYLPHLDYDLQRFGPDSPQAFQSLEKASELLSNVWKTARAAGYDVLVFGDYAIEPVTAAPVFPNRALRQAGLMSVRTVRGMAYPDFFAGAAFAVADHQVAHVYVRNPQDVGRVRAVLERLPGVGEVLDRAVQAPRGIAHARSGELVLVAAKGSWFAYPWWENRREAPDYASHVDIHNKPGYDPCELFFRRDPLRIRGSHGRAGAGCEVAWTASFELPYEPATLVDLARSLGAK